MPPRICLAFSSSTTLSHCSVGRLGQFKDWRARLPPSREQELSMDRARKGQSLPLALHMRAPLRLAQQKLRPPWGFSDTPETKQ